MKVKHSHENVFRLYLTDDCLDGNYWDFYDTEFVVFYNTLAKDCNKHLGTNFEYDMEMVNRCNKDEVWGNINVPKEMYLYGRDGGKGYEIEEHYAYKGEGSCYPNGEMICTSTHGWYSNEDIIEILKTMHDFMPKLKEISEYMLKKKYLDYDSIGIRYSKVPDYFDKLACSWS